MDKMDNTLMGLVIIGILTVTVAGLSTFIWMNRAKLNAASEEKIGQGKGPDAEAEAEEGEDGEKGKKETIIISPPCASFLDNLEWRRAVKHFSPGEVDYEPIYNAILNAPSSFGLQPYKVLVVHNQDKKKELRGASFNQAQVEESYGLFGLCAMNVVEKRVDQYISESGSDTKKEMITGFLEQLPNKEEWAKRQAYIALGYGMAAASERMISTCPMEGFDAAAYSKILEIDEGLLPCALLAVGRAEPSEKFKPRFRFSDIFKIIS